MMFLHPPLKEIKSISNILQSNAANNMKMHGELETYFVALSIKILAPAIFRYNSTKHLCDLDISSGFCLLPVDAIDLGTNFQH